MVPKLFEDRLSHFKETPTKPIERPAWLVNWSELEVGNLVGSGSFGSVYAVKHNGQQAVLKEFMKQKYTETAVLQMRVESAKLMYVPKKKKKGGIRNQILIIL